MKTVVKENEIRPEELVKKQQQFVENDRRFLLDRHDKWVNVSCPACNSPQNKFFDEKFSIKYMECSNCKTVYTNPRPDLNTLIDFYQSSENYAFWNEYIFPATAEVRRENIFKPRVEKICEIIKRHRLKAETMVEVGAGYGFFCDEMQKKGIFKRIIAIEPTMELAETCRKINGIEVINKPVEQVQLDFKADMIVSFEVIEHLFSPKDFVMSCKTLLNDGGIAVFSCPNVKGFDVSMLRMNSSTFDHEHMNYFNPDSIQHLLSECGFEIVEVSTPGLLDVDIVKKAFLNNEIDADKNTFIKELVTSDEKLAERFQLFLQENKLSSHMWCVARKR
jgi:2-polyprenyl-3-methyl-5-hydroxy-6-metoxy-1,4-benzoquinol methylase